MFSQSGSDFSPDSESVVQKFYRLPFLLGLHPSEAADAHDLNIQYCLTLTRCGMQALEIPRVTMARATADYAYNFVQWTIGITGMITDVLGRGQKESLIQR